MIRSAAPLRVCEIRVRLDGGSAYHSHHVTARVDVPDGSSITVPCFWDGNSDFVARVRATAAGVYRAVFTDGCGACGEMAADVEVTKSQSGVLPGVVRSSRRGPYLERVADDEPFLWIGDTWWYAFSDRISDQEFHELAARRARDGYNCIQLVAGLYPEARMFDAMTSTDGRFAWDQSGEHIDPEWWRGADRRMRILAEQGFTIAVVSAWSYYLLDLGDEKMRRHWRETVARWSALPVVWCVAGEAGLPHYEDAFGPDASRVSGELTAAWCGVGNYVREIDPYQLPMTYHPCTAFHHTSVEIVQDRAPLDLIWMQTGHMDRWAVPQSLQSLRAAREAKPQTPVINSEVCYEGIAGGSLDPIQRFLFWAHVLSGAAGHTYGAQGLWAMASPSGPSPGRIWGETSWHEAADLSGARHVGLGGQIFSALDWTALRPDPGGISVAAGDGAEFLPYCASSSELRVVYVPVTSFLEPGDDGLVRGLQNLTLVDLPAGRWTVEYVNPRNGSTTARIQVDLADRADWPLPQTDYPTPFASMEDWLVICRRDAEGPS